MSSSELDIHEALKLSLSDKDAQSMDDERRSVPQGWVRAFDTNSKEHFYVDESTNRSSWLHPYDDPEYIRTLPITDPANPQSTAATTARMRIEDENALMEAKQSEADAKERRLSQSQAANGGADGHKEEKEKAKSWFQKTKESFSGGHDSKHKEALEHQRKVLKIAEENFLKRRASLSKRSLSDPSIKKMYAADPFKYSAPTEAFARNAASPVGYGYPGGYERRYTPMFGFGMRPGTKGEGGVFWNSIIAQQGIVPGMGPKTNYGFGG